VVRDRIELSTFRFSGQPRQALCRPAKTDVTDKRNRARRKVQKQATPGIAVPQGIRYALGQGSLSIVRPVTQSVSLLEKRLSAGQPYGHGSTAAHLGETSCNCAIRLLQDAPQLLRRSPLANKDRRWGCREPYRYHRSGI
jgi:hypothetical protein